MTSSNMQLGGFVEGLIDNIGIDYTDYSGECLSQVFFSFWHVVPFLIVYSTSPSLFIGSCYW